MGWSAGVFSRTNGTNTGTEVWANDRDEPVSILASRHDTHDQDLSDGISACLAKDGSNAATGDLDLGTHKLTAVTDGTAASDAATFGQVSECAKLDTAQEYTATQNFNATTLTDGANISWDAAANQVASVTLAGNRTLDNPTNMVDGATYILTVKQDATGTRTLAYGTAYKWAGGTAPTLTTTASAVDIITFVCDGSSMYGVITQDFS